MRNRNAGRGIAVPRKPVINTVHLTGILKLAGGSARVIFIEKARFAWGLSIPDECEVYLSIIVPPFADINAQIVSRPSNKAGRVEHNFLLRVVARIAVVDNVRQNFSEGSIRLDVLRRAAGRDQTAGRRRHRAIVRRDGLSRSGRPKQSDPV